MESQFELDVIEFIDTPVSVIGDEPSASQKCERFIAFYFGHSIYCVRAEKVAEVIHALPVAMLPSSPHGISGITAIRGEVIAVVNLPELTNQEGGAEHDESKMVVLRSPENQTQFAIPADQMHPVVMLPGSLIDGAKGFITPIEHEGGLYKVIDTEMLYAEIAAHI